MDLQTEVCCRLSRADAPKVAVGNLKDILPGVSH